jgi:hypothetical protein
VGAAAVAAVEIKAVDAIRINSFERAFSWGFMVSSFPLQVSIGVSANLFLRRDEDGFGSGEYQSNAKPISASDGP